MTDGKTQQHTADDELLNALFDKNFPYFLNEINPKNGLVSDRTEPGAPASISAVGLALACYVAAAERKSIAREEAAKKVRTTLRFFFDGKQGEEEDAMGYKGFYYHFLDMQNGNRANDCELSTIDTALFVAGALVARCYFTDDKEICGLADKLYKRIDWRWATDGKAHICHGWKPTTGFLENYWDEDYSEAMLLYILALGSPDFGVAKKTYLDWTNTFKIKSVYGIEYLYAGPLFVHQLSHLWIDFRGISDDFNRKMGFDYFENSRRATIVQREYAIRNPNAFDHYGADCWGVTASDGPGEITQKIHGIRRSFLGYSSRGVPFGVDDGTISPWAAATSLPFAPEIVLPTIRRFVDNRIVMQQPKYGLGGSFNTIFRDPHQANRLWISPFTFALNQGPVVLMIANYQSGLIWNIMKNCPYTKAGLRNAAFTGGWLDANW